VGQGLFVFIYITARLAYQLQRLRHHLSFMLPNHQTRNSREFDR